MSRWQWCLEDDNKVLVTGWAKVGDYWYYLNSNGVMATGWIQDNAKWYYLDSTGRILTGWQKIDNKDYCFANDGSLYANCTTPDGYEVDSNGVWIDSLVSNDCLNFVKGYEKFYPNKYDDNTGTITQGYGATGAEIANWGNTITEEEASEELKTVINTNYAKPIKADLDSRSVALAQNQFDAIVSCAYNIGVGDSNNGLLGSTLYKYIVSGGRDANKITTYFRMWNKVIENNVAVVWPGLDKRRIAESNMFNNNIYNSDH
ncbi:MAG: cell wall binding repeat domain protein [Clostridiaceae bacterium]|jgi:lysozyme|nr:cell wall binding repeat domain protein [Clostridiaceae bacterium]